MAELILRSLRHLQRAQFGLLSQNRGHIVMHTDRHFLCSVYPFVPYEYVVM